jgi:hypothetical protein
MIMLLILLEIRKKFLFSVRQTCVQYKHKLTTNIFSIVMLFHSCKVVVIASLAAVFLLFFGYPSYVKYLNQDTVFTESSVKFDPQKPVGITIFAWQTYKFYGWKE